MVDAGPFRILYVCTANICRSPVAELVARAISTASNVVEVRSAGVDARVGSAVDGPSAALLIRWGLDPSEHVARQLSPQDAATADLVLTAEKSQRDIVMGLAPTAYRRTFTMLEFTRLVGRVDPGSARELVGRVSGIRSIDGPLPELSDDISDPFRRGPEEALRVGTQVADSARDTIQALGLARPARPRPPAPRRPTPHRRP